MNERTGQMKHNGAANGAVGRMSRHPTAPSLRGRSDGPRSIVFHHDSHGFGGMELYLFNLIEHLDAERYSSALLVPGFTDEYRSTQERVLDDARTRGIPVLRPPDPGSQRGVSSFRELVSTARVLRDHGADLVHIHTCRPTGARKVTLSTRLARVPGLVRTEHFPPTVTSGPSDWYRVRPFDWLTDCIVTGSEGDRAEQIRVLRRPAGKVVRCYNSVVLDGLDPHHDVARAKQQLGLDAGVPVVANVGRLVEQKGQRYLIEAFATVLERCGPAVLLIVGDGPLLAELESLCERLGVAGSVRFVGHQHDVVPYMQAADVAAMPSLYEVFSLAMLEFMALGKPVVGSDHSSFTEAITNGREGLIVPRERSGPLADALVRLLQDEALRSRLGEAGLTRVRAHFGFDRLAADMMEIYDRVSARHGG